MTCPSSQNVILWLLYGVELLDVMFNCLVLYDGLVMGILDINTCYVTFICEVISDDF